MDEILKRIDVIIKALDGAYYSEYAYKDHIFEIKQIIVSTVGTNSNSYTDYSAIASNKNIDYGAACRYLKGVLQGLRSDLIFKKNSEKRYQFFISSTFQDLEHYRKAVADGITFKGHFYAGMEDFTACGDDLVAYIKREIDKSDYYILLIGQRWGTALPEDENTSYTMMEYNYAKSKGMRIIPMIYNGDLPLSGNDLEINKKKFDKFVSEIAKTTPQYFKEENELIRKISKAIDNAIKNYPQKGWIRL